MLHQYLDVEASDNGDNQGLIKSDERQNQGKRVLVAIQFFTIVLSCILLWYFTNGFNGISMQSYARRVRSLQGYSDELVLNVSIMATVTAIQLGLGAIIGYVLLKFGFSPLTKSETCFWALVTGEETFSGSLHGVGSICTNLGFMYGSASLVQILKLMEPFETLAFSQLLTPQEGKCTFGVVSSMILVVGAAVSLIRIQSEIPHSHAIFFALFSGCTLSLRNVLQRMPHLDRSSISTDIQDGHQKPQPKSSNIEKMEDSVIQFTQLSYRSARIVGAGALLLNLLALPQFAALGEFNWGVLTWHPLYNIFSMITLGFCSSLTHSLLNAGKRVFAIVLAILWFREEITLATIAGLTTVAGGGMWYTMESMGQNTMGGGSKLVLAVVVLVILFDYQTVAMSRGLGL
jgi:Triose-phosphate Transporter family